MGGAVHSKKPYTTQSGTDGHAYTNRPVEPPQIGRSVRRKEGRAKVTGQALYVDDVAPAGMLHGVTVRSPVPRGRIKRIRSIPPSPGTSSSSSPPPTSRAANRVKLIVDDQPYLASDVVNHPEEPVVLIAHRDRARADDARRHVTIDIEPLPAGPDDRRGAGRARDHLGHRQLFKSYSVVEGGRRRRVCCRRPRSSSKGSTRPARRNSSTSSRTACSPIADPKHGVTVWGSMQCPYYIHDALAGLFNLPPDRIRVVQMETGGGFGGKEEYPSVIAGHAALLAWKSGRPVKMIYGRTEDMAATTKRHPARTQAPDRGDARRPAARDGHRLHDRRRRVLHAVAGRAVARHDSRRGPVFVPQRARAAGALSRPTSRRTARSAVSARRRASSRSSGTWTGSRPPSVCRRRSSAAATSSSPATRSRSGRPSREPVDMAGAARSRARRRPTIARSASASRARIRAVP